MTCNDSKLIISELLSAQSIYSMAFESALTIFELSVRFPKDGQDSLHNRVIKSSSGVCSHLLGAWQNRDNNRIFHARLDKASIDISDTQSQIEEAVEAKLLDKKSAMDLFEVYDRIIDRIVTTIKDFKQ